MSLLRDIVIGILKEGIDLVNYVIILEKLIFRPVGAQELNPTLTSLKKN